MIIIEDKGQKEGKHKLKHNYFANRGIELQRYPLPVGDYAICNDKMLDVIMRKAVRGQEPKKMDFLGTYSRVVDTKKDIQELIGNICGAQHNRFRDECILAQNNGIELFVLVENEPSVIIPKWGDKTPIHNSEVHNLQELFRWVNPRLFLDYKQIYGYSNGKKTKVACATKGKVIAKACITMQEKYGVKFVFCNPKNAGQRVLELLRNGK